MLSYINDISKVFILFFTVVSDWVVRIVVFHWYWYRLINVWYCDIPTDIRVLSSHLTLGKKVNK